MRIVICCFHVIAVVFMRSLLLVLITVICFACGVGTSEIGLDFFKEGSLDVSFIDSATVRLSTVRFDSLITSGSTRMLLGSYPDPRLGRITAIPYFQVGWPGAIDLAHTNISFDYLALVLKYDGYSYYDTSSLLRLNAYFVTQTIAPAAPVTSLYNTSHYAFNPIAIGSAAIKPRPHRSDSIELKLPSSFGQALFNKAKAGDTDFASQEKFLKYLRGFVLIPDTTTSSPIVGIKSTSALRLYYQDKNETPVKQKYISFLVSGGNFSTRIVTNREDSNLKKLTSYKTKVLAKYTNNEAYVQGGAGLALRIDIPYLRDLKQLSNFYITQAVLDVYPLRKSYNGATRLPNKLSVYTVNKQNTFFNTTAATALLVEDTDLQRDTHYSMDLTTFVKGQMDMEELNENALLFLLDDTNFRLGADRIYFASPSYEYKTQLRIYYATINE
jgi:hypothetical protein